MANRNGLGIWSARLDDWVPACRNVEVAGVKYGKEHMGSMCEE